MLQQTQPADIVQDAGRATALLSPLRMKMLERMGEPQSASSLGRELRVPRQKLNYHLRELERNGFVEFVEERRRGNCTERLYRAAARHYVIDPAVLGRLGADPQQMQDRFSAAYLVAVAAKTIRDVAQLRERAQKAGKRLATLTLQADVRFASAADRAAFVEELTGEIARLVAKYHDEHAEGGRSFEFLVGAYPKIANKNKNNDKDKDQRTGSKEKPS